MLPAILLHAIGLLVPVCGSPYYSLSDTPIFNRAVDARMFRFGRWVFSNDDLMTQTPFIIADMLAKLSPTFVHGLIYKQAGANFTDEEVATYIMVRNSILKTSPHCKFSLLLDGSSFLTINLRSLSALLKNYNYYKGRYPDFHIDSIHFENWTASFSNEKALGSYAVQLIHSMEMLVGGNIYETMEIPDNTDYVGLSTNNFKINAQVSYPAIGLINNLNPNDFGSEACAFKNYSGFSSGRFKALSNGDRITVLQGLKAQENMGGFKMAWPVFSPLCPSQSAFDSTNNGVYNWIKQNGLLSPISVVDYEISKTPQEEVVTPFRRNITTPASPNIALKLITPIISFVWLRITLDIL